MLLSPESSPTLVFKAPDSKFSFSRENLAFEHAFMISAAGRAFYHRRENLRRLGKRFAGSLALIMLFSARSTPLSYLRRLRPHTFPRVKKRNTNEELLKSS